MPEQTVALNRRARHDYAIEQTLEAGLVLTGTEIKSIRAGRVNLAEAYARIERGEAWLIGAHIAPYEQGNRNNHEPTRTRKLLLHRDQIAELVGPGAVEGLHVFRCASTSRTASPSWSWALGAARRPTTSGGPSPSATCVASWRGRPRLGSGSSRIARRCLKVNARSHSTLRVVVIGPSIGSWGCQVSTGLRNRELQVEVARMASLNRGQASNWQSSSCSRCLDSEH